MSEHKFYCIRIQNLPIIFQARRHNLTWLPLEAGS